MYLLFVGTIDHAIANVLLSKLELKFHRPTKMISKMESLLFQAIIARDRALAQTAIQTLVQTNASIDFEDPEGLTPLQVAVSAGWVEIISLLAAAGANIHVRDIHGGTLAHLAAELKDTRIYEVLHQIGASMIEPDDAKCLPIHSAVFYGDLEGVKFLCQLGSPVDPVNDSDETPIVRAVRKGNIPMIRLLHQLGADINRLHSQQSLFHVAAGHESVELISVLLELECIHLKTRNRDRGHAPLVEACRRGRLENVKLILTAGQYHLDDTFWYEASIETATQFDYAQILELLLRSINSRCNSRVRVVHPKASSNCVDILQATNWIVHDLNDVILPRSQKLTDELVVEIRGRIYFSASLFHQLLQWLE